MITIIIVHIWVATVPTACGIETISNLATKEEVTAVELQQCLPLAVLKRVTDNNLFIVILIVLLQQCLPLAVLKQFLYEGKSLKDIVLQQCLPLAVLKPCILFLDGLGYWLVATVLTACGIETLPLALNTPVSITLQQCLPLAVLKQHQYSLIIINSI